MSKTTPKQAADDAPAAVKAASQICHVDDALPGITRRKFRSKWAYHAPDGERIIDRDEIDRLNRIALPPAYVNCWFCPSPDGHIQAVGYDDKGRKQYRYHLEFRASQEAAKYEKLAAFGRALPLIRARVENDLAQRSLDKNTVAAAVVRLLDLGQVRVGNDQYARENKHFGATTLRSRHARPSAGKLKLEFTGKSGKAHCLTIEDRRLSTIARRCQDLPGQRLFQYLDAEGGRHPVTSSDVNSYLREASGGGFTAKHFRTWGASVLAFRALIEAGEHGLTLKKMLEPVCAALGNTPAIARKSYVHPALIELATAKAPIGDLRLPRATKYLSPVERGLIAFLDELEAVAGHEAKQAA